MPVKPMLGGIELQQVQKIETDEDQVLTQHGVPALEGDFLQRLGRRATRITLSGVMTGADAGASLKTLRDKYREGEPVSFVADIATATKVDRVLIEELGIRELAGKPARFEYELTLREMIPPPEPVVVDQFTPPDEPTPEEPVDPKAGKLIVEVIVEDEPDFDFSTLTVTAEGNEADGTSLSRTLTDRTGNNWTDENMPPGQFTARARVGDRSGTATAAILAMQTTQVTITLRSVSTVAKMFILHFRFDKAFVEPCMRRVLREAVKYAGAHSDEKLLILGHTDKVDTDAYNQSLSERRARAVHAFLTFGRARQAAIDEWEALRQPRNPPGEVPTVEDRWGAREYQHILQELEFYPGKIDGDHGPMTDEAVRAYRCHKGMPPGTQVDNEVWRALIVDYMALDNFAAPEDQFFLNCNKERVKWLGAGEEDPVKNVFTPHRPNRRVELLFVRAEKIPCEVPQPDTFALPKQGAVNADWCIGPKKPGGNHVCFVSKHLDAKGNPQPCSPTPGGPWCREPADPRNLDLQVSIKNEDGTPLRNQQFAVITPKGEFLQSEIGRGEAAPATTDSNGVKVFGGKPAGFYSLEVFAPVLARIDGEGDETIRGRIVCKELRASSDHLDVIIVNAPLLREIKLPVVAHLLTARNAGGVVHSTIRNEGNVRGVFTEINRIWRQARIRLEVVDVVTQTYTPPVPQPGVNRSEFDFVCANGGFPNVVNVFYVNDVDNPVEDGWSASFEEGTNTPGCMIETLDDHTSAVVTAHQLGHFLNLKHAEDQPGAKGPFSDRLMHVGVSVPEPRLLSSEVATARASRGAGLECIPLSMRVTGAAQVDGSHSPDFIALRNAVAAPIMVEAVISPGLLALGTLTMTGGDEVPGFPLRRSVKAGNTGLTPVEAVYTRVAATPSGPVTETIRHRVRIIVVNFDLEVRGAQRVGGPGSNIFAAQSQAVGVVEVVANLTPASALPPFIIDGMVQWVGGRAVLGDPFRRTVSKVESVETTITATVAGTTLTRVIRVLDLAFVANTSPFDTVLTEVRWEGAFRIRADLPGETRDELVVHLTGIKRR